MKTRSRDGTTIRSILAGMVVDRTVCSRIASQWPEGGLFDAPWANLVGQWCVEHVRKYGEPPNGKLRLIYDEWTETTTAPTEVVRGVESFLSAADAERTRALTEELNSEYVLDKANRYFNSVRIKKALRRSEELLELGRVEEAQSTLLGLSKVELGSTSVIKVATDWDVWRKAWDDEQGRAMVTYPGRMQEVLGRWLQRDSFFSFMAPDKTGKSVFLLDLAVRATRNRCRVLYVDCGDNSQDQVLRRLGSRVARHPGRETFQREIDVPVSIEKVEGEFEVEIGSRKFGSPLSASSAFRRVGRLCRGMDRLRVVCYPNSTASVATIDQMIVDWDLESGWVPDVVVIDYADILAPPAGIREPLEQIDATWKQLRRLSQRWHCLVMTATQASAEAYSDKATVLRKKHFSGRKTKLAHVNGMIGINVSDKDRSQGISRLNWVVRREGRYSEVEQVVVAGCWAWYDPVVRVCG